MLPAYKQNKKNSLLYKHRDWVCLYCQNLNYSFRQRCNRCQVQTKQNNEMMRNDLIQRQRQYYEQVKINSMKKFSQYFPKRLFMMIDDQPWQQIYNTNTNQCTIICYSPKGKQNLNNQQWLEFLIQD